MQRDKIEFAKQINFYFQLISYGSYSKIPTLPSLYIAGKLGCHFMETGLGGVKASFQPNSIVHINTAPDPSLMKELLINQFKSTVDWRMTTCLHNNVQSWSMSKYVYIIHILLYLTKWGIHFFPSYMTGAAAIRVFVLKRKASRWSLLWEAGYIISNCCLLRESAAQEGNASLTASFFL